MTIKSSKTLVEEAMKEIKTYKPQETKELYDKKNSIFESKINLLSAKGINAFMTFQLPKAIISLKQGAGRLIRDEEDKGVLMICDQRIIAKPYGKSFWRSLPSFKRTRNQEDVIEFLKHL